jgi:hypothetical protein
MYAMNIQNDVIGLVLRENCKSKQMTDIIAWRFWNVGQANCILKYFENMMIDHSDYTIF